MEPRQETGPVQLLQSSFLKGETGNIFFSLNWRFWLKKECSAVKQEGSHISYVLPGSSVSLLSQLGWDQGHRGRKATKSRGRLRMDTICGLSVPSL